jgi:predicted O-methyltransferase YrrM
MLDDRVLAVLERLEREDAAERERGLAPFERSRAVAPTTGRFLFSVVAPNPGCEVLEIGGSRGYSSIWLAAGARILGGRVVSLEIDLAKVDTWRGNVAQAGVDEWVQLVPGDAHETIPAVGEFWDIVFLDAEKEDYEALFQLVRPKVDIGGLIIADNVLSHPDPLAGYVAARQSDPTLSSVTVPLDRGLELSVVLSERLE